MISRVNTEYTAKQNMLKEKILSAEQRELQATALKSSITAEINAKATSITKNFTAQLESEYEQTKKHLVDEYLFKKACIYTTTLGALLYGLFITILQACFSERFSNDFIIFLSKTWAVIEGIFQFGIDLASCAWTIRHIINCAYLDVIIAGLLTLVVFVCVVGFLYGCIAYGFYKIWQFYAAEFTDLTSLIVALMSAAVLVWFADSLSFVPWNMVVIWLTIHGIYLLIRMFASTSKKTGYY